MVEYTLLVEQDHQRTAHGDGCVAEGIWCVGNCCWSADVSFCKLGARQLCSRHSFFPVCGNKSMFFSIFISHFWHALLCEFIFLFLFLRKSNEGWQLSTTLGLSSHFLCLWMGSFLRVEWWHWFRIGYGSYWSTWGPVQLLPKGVHVLTWNLKTWSLSWQKRFICWF